MWMGAAVDVAAYTAALLADRREIRIAVDVLDAEETPRGSLTSPESRLVSGAINVDAAASPTRTCDLTLVDPQRTLRFEPANPAEGALYADSMISVTYGLRLADRSWVDVPVFRGPITKFARTGPDVTLAAAGKESLMLAPATAYKPPHQVDQHTETVEAIDRLARFFGERRLDLARISPPHHTTDKMSVAPKAEPWPVLQRLAHEATRQLYYTGAGVLRLRELPTKPVFTFGEDLITSEPALEWDMSDVRNLVSVSGDKGKPQVARPPATHPLSPDALGRNGTPRYLAEWLDAGKQGPGDRQRMADKGLELRLRETLTVSFSAVPVPHLEEGDPVRIEWGDLVADFPMSKFTIPLTTDAMSVGTMSKVRVSGRRVPTR